MSLDSEPRGQKFLQRLFIQMASSYGVGFLSTVSSSMGFGQGKHYIEERELKDLKEGLKFLIQEMGGDLNLRSPPKKEKGTSYEKRSPKNSLEVVAFSGEYCSIGGKKEKIKYEVKDEHHIAKDYERYEIFSKGICMPYIAGFLKAYGLNAKVESEECILKEGCSYCHVKITLWDLKRNKK